VALLCPFKLIKKIRKREKKDQEIHELKEQVEEIRDLYQDLIKTLNEAVDLREKIRANPKEFLEADPFKFAAMQKRRYNGEVNA
jgi:Rad3-related DNA helicase